MDAADEDNAEDLPEDCASELEYSDSKREVALSRNFGGDIPNPPKKPNAWIDESSTGLLAVVKWEDGDGISAENTGAVLPKHENSGNDIVGRDSEIVTHNSTTSPKASVYEVTWEPNEGDSPQRTTEKQMKIPLKPGQTYLIRIQAIIDGRAGPPSDTVKFRSAPRRPINLTVEQDSENSVEVKFEDPDDEAKKYRLYIVSSELREKKTLDTEMKSFHLKDLMPGARYEISIEALQTNIMIQHTFNFESAKESIAFTLRPLPPEQLHCEIYNEGYKLSWKKVPKSKKYIVKWTDDDNGTKTVYSESCDLTHDDLKPGKSYEIKVYSYSHGNKMSDPAVLAFDSVPLSPHDISVTLDGHLAIVTFRDDSKAETTYEVVAQPIDGAKPLLENVNHPVAQLQLEPDRCYHIYVRAVQGDKKSRKAEYDKLVATRPTPPKNLRKDRDGDEYTVSWDEVEKAARYRVEWEDISGESKSTEVYSAVCRFTASDLKPGKRNRILVFALYSQQRISDAAVIDLGTAPRKPSNIRVKCEEYRMTVEFDDDSDAKNEYEVVAEPTTGGDAIKSMTDIRSATLTLTPGIDYKVSVHAIRSKLRSTPAKYSKLVHTCPSAISKLSVRNIEKKGCRLLWKSVAGATSYEITVRGRGDERKRYETQEEAYHIHDIDQAVTYAIEAYAKNDAGISKPCRTKILAVPKNIRMELVSLGKIAIRCDQVIAAMSYCLVEINDGSPMEPVCTASNHGTQENQNEVVSITFPSFERELEREREGIKVKIWAQGGDGCAFSESVEYRFRNISKLVQDFFQRKASNIMSPEQYVIPQTSPKLLPNETFESQLSPSSGESVLVQGGHFCGKTSLCAHLVLKNPPSRLAILIDANVYKPTTKSSVCGLLRGIFPFLEEEEQMQLISWMDRNSKDVLFMLDNAPIPTNQELITRLSEERQIFDIFADLTNPQRHIFPNSGVLCTSSWRSAMSEWRCSRGFAIDGFHQREVNHMVSACRKGNNVTIPERIRFLCVNPGFCSVIVRKLREGGTPCLGDCLIEVPDELIEQIPRDQRTHTITSLVRDIRGITQMQNGGQNAWNAWSKKMTSRSESLTATEETCWALQIEYQIVLYCVFIMTKDKFKKHVRNNFRRTSFYCRKWIAISSLLAKKDRWVTRPSDFLQEINGKESEINAKRAALRKAIENKESDLKELKRNDANLAKEWMEYKAALIP